MYNPFEDPNEDRNNLSQEDVVDGLFGLKRAKPRGDALTYRERSTRLQAAQSTSIQKSNKARAERVRRLELEKIRKMEEEADAERILAMKIQQRRAEDEKRARDLEEMNRREAERYAKQQADKEARRQAKLEAINNLTEEQRLQLKAEQNAARVLALKEKEERRIASFLKRDKSVIHLLPEGYYDHLKYMPIDLVRLLDKEYRAFVTQINKAIKKMGVTMFDTLNESYDFIQYAHGRDLYKDVQFIWPTIKGRYPLIVTKQGKKHIEYVGECLMTPAEVQELFNMNADARVAQLLGQIA